MMLYVILACSAPPDPAPDGAVDTVAHTGASGASADTADSSPPPPTFRQWPSIAMGEYSACRVGPEGRLDCWGCWDEATGEWGWEDCAINCGDIDCEAAEVPDMRLNGKEVRWVRHTAYGVYCAQWADYRVECSRGVFGEGLYAHADRTWGSQPTVTCLLSVEEELECQTWSGYETNAPKGRFLDVCLDAYACAISADTGLLKCWGTSADYPPPSPPQVKVTQLDCGLEMTCAVTAHGRIGCFSLAAMGTERVC